MKSLLELEKEIDLSEYERKLGNKRTKAGKYYWLSSLIVYKSYLNKEISVNWESLCEEYGNIFYRRFELVADILQQFDGMPTREMKQLPIEETKRIFEIKFKKQSLELEKRLRDWLKRKEVDFNHIEPEEIDFYNLDFLDNRQPELPLISDCFKRLLDAADYCYKANKLIISIHWKLKPSTVKKTFGTVMDKMVRFEQMYWVSDYIEAYLSTSNDTFRAKEKTEGPTDALNKVMTYSPQTVNMTDKQLKYHLILKYCKSNGENFTKEELRKPVKRFREDA